MLEDEKNTMDVIPSEKNCLANSEQGQMIGTDTICLLHQKQANY
jgi:hypothetical protein